MGTTTSGQRPGAVDRVSVLHGPPRTALDFAPPEPTEALIEEARRRRRRRWRRVAIGCVAVALVGWIVDVVGAGGRGVNSARHPVRASAVPSAVPEARWHRLTAEELPRGSTVNSIVSYRGTLYAAGTYFSGGSPALGYPRYSEPFVWASADGGPWRPVWPSSGGVVVGTGADQHLLSTPIGLLLFAGGTPGSAMWRLVGPRFVRVDLPPLMESAAIDGAAWNDGRLVVMESDKYATPYGGSAVIWSSSNGVSWTRDQLPGEPYLTSLVATSWGFAAGGRSSSTAHAEVWTSTDGLIWHAEALGAVNGSATVASRGSTVVADDAQAVPNRLWWSDDGTTWKQARVVGRLVSPPYSGMVSGSFGFAVPGRSGTTLWYSPTGRRWVQLRNVGSLPAEVTVSGLFAIRGGVLAVVYRGNSPDEFWQVEIARSRAVFPGAGDEVGPNRIVGGST